MKYSLLLLLIFLPETIYAQKISFNALNNSMSNTVSEFNKLLSKKDFLPLVDLESGENIENVWTGKTLFGKHKVTIQVESFESNDEIVGEILLDFNDNLPGKLMYSKLERKIIRRCEYIGSRKMKFLYNDNINYQTHIHTKMDIEFRLFFFEGHRMIKILHQYKGENY